MDARFRHAPRSPFRWLGIVAVALAALVFVVPGAVAKQAPSLLRVSSDPYTNPASQHRTEVEPDSFAARGRVVTAFQVGRIFDGGAANIGWATSRNGGIRFSSGFLPGITKIAGGTHDRASDPSVAYDAAHGVWLISSLALDEPVHGAAVVVNRSRDGLSWSRPSNVAVASGRADFDKNWTTCDSNRRSPFYGHCYTEFDDVGDADRVKMSTSTDGGLTWSAPTNTAGNDLGFGGQPVVQPNGTVIVPIATLGGAGMQAFRSTDGGRTWSAAVRFTAAPVHPAAGGLRVTRGTLFPSAEVDRDGKVYVAWEDCRFRTGCSANDIVFSTTTDGLNWSPVRRIPIDPIDSGVDHFIPGLAVDPRRSGARARLALTYYSYPEAECTAASCQLEVGVVSSGDGGTSWSAPTQLAGPMRLDWLPETSQGRMVGDYVSTSFVHGRAVPFFAQAGPPTRGLLDEAIATIRGGIRFAGSRTRASASGANRPPAQRLRLPLASR
jgi:hypothetical protein